MSQRVYLPRDVINAPDIKARIAARSAERDDPEDIAAWMGNHFYRYVIGNFTAPAPAVQPITHWLEVETRLPDPAPDWAHKACARLQAQSTSLSVWWVEPDSDALLALEARLLEFLRARRGTALEGKLQRINCPQALARWALEHQTFAQRRARGLFEHQPDAVKAILQGEHGVFVEFDPQSPNLRVEMAWESQMMGHCLGRFTDRTALTGGYGEQYASACEAGALRLFSYRRGRTHPQPHITVSAEVHHDGRVQISQIKGKQNRPPVQRYQADVLALLNYLPTDDRLPSDARNLDLLRRPEHLRQHGEPAWCCASDLRSEAECLWLARTRPDLLDAQHLESPLMQWWVAARREEIPQSLLSCMPRSAAVAQALALAGQV